MKARLILRFAVCTLLAVSVCVSAWQTTSAGGPPVRLAVHEVQLSGTSSTNQVPGSGENLDRGVPDLDSITGLIPTRWEPNSQLIPTEIEARSLLVRRGWTDGTHFAETTQPAQQGEINVFLNQQILSITPRNTSSTPEVGAWISPARVTGGTRVATVPKSLGRRRQTATNIPPEEIPQQK